MFRRLSLTIRLVKMGSRPEAPPSGARESKIRAVSGMGRILQKVAAAALAVFGLLIAPSGVLARPGSGGHGGGGGAGHYAGGAHFAGGWGGRGYYGWGGYRGYGWAPYRGYGWRYPYYGYGLGLGVGVGIGYGLYPGYWYGYGYPYPAYGYYGYYANVPDAAGYAGTYGPVPYVAPPPPAVAVESSASVEEAAVEAAGEFADKGKAAFKAGDYAGAVYALRHAAVDDPHNAELTLLLGQALFATGRYDEAAGATQAAMRRLPKEKWGAVISHYTELYGNTRDYTNQLRALEKRLKEKPNEPALRFLAGFHYAYLGFATQAIDQLDKVLTFVPRDDLARQLRDELRDKLGKPSVVPILPAPAIPGEPQGPALEP